MPLLPRSPRKAVLAECFRRLMRVDDFPVVGDNVRLSNEEEARRRVWTHRLLNAWLTC